MPLNAHFYQHHDLNIQNNDAYYSFKNINAVFSSINQTDKPRDDIDLQHVAIEKLAEAKVILSINIFLHRQIFLFKKLNMNKLYHLKEVLELLASGKLIHLL